MNSSKPEKNIILPLLVGLLVIGICLRLLFQFYEPAFYLDEIHLGNNIKNLSFSELLFPPSNFQSAPPLYLLTQKAIICAMPFSFWIKIKLLSTFCAIGSLILFYRILKTRMLNIYGILMLALFVFNPFIIYNSLTVKQYTCDLFGVMLLLNFYNHPKFRDHSWMFFMVWILFSNAALFCCAGYLLFRFIHWLRDGKLNIWHFIKSHITIILAPIPYVIYVFWYLNQDGATAQQDYMLHVWRNTFITLDFEGLRLLLTIGHVIYTHFFSINEIWGIIMSLICVSGMVLLIRKRNLFQHPVLVIGACIFAIHLLFNALHIYPIVERSILYLVPFFILLFGYGLKETLKAIRFKKAEFIIILAVTLISLSLYATYLPQKKNDVVRLYKNLENLNNLESFYITPRALEGINKYNAFTDKEFQQDINFHFPDSKLDKSRYLISWVHKKLKPQNLSNNEPAVKRLLDQDKIILIDHVDSYNIYKFR